MGNMVTLDTVLKQQASQDNMVTLEQVRAAQPPESGGAVSQVAGLLKLLTPAGLASALATPEGRETVGNFTLGGVRGAADIGNTAVGAATAVVDKVGGGQGASRWNQERKETLGQFFDERIPKVDAAAAVGRVATNVAGTAGIGPAMAAQLLRVLPAASPIAQALIQSVRSGGMTTGAQGLNRAVDMGIRAGGGAVTGAASAGLVDPDSAGTGAIIGGVMPGALKVAEKGVDAAAFLARQGSHAMRRGAAPLSDVRTAREIAELAGARTPTEVAAVRDALRATGPQIVPGGATVPEILLTPGTSQLQRTVATVNPGAFAASQTERDAARRAVLDRIAPTGHPPSEVAEEVGNAIQNYALPAERRAAQQVNALFDAIPPDEAMIQLPLERMQAAQARYLGPGTFGKGAASAEQAMRTATDIGMDPVARIDPRAVPFNQIQALRSSIGEAITDAQANGRNQAAAALTAMKNSIDDRVAEVAAGTRLQGEVFTPEAVDLWGQALAAHRTKQLRFDTGPQTAMFRRGGDNLPAAQGGEIPRRFFNSGGSQASDAQSFRTLVQDDPQLMQDLRRYAVSDAAAQVDRTGRLTSAKFQKWMNARAAATGEIFTPEQQTWLRAIAHDLRRADTAENLGRVTGSDTAQKANSALKLGLIDHPALKAAAGTVPAGERVLEFFAGPARTARAERLGQLMTNPEETAALLDAYLAIQRPTTAGGFLSSPAGGFLGSSAPVVLTGPR